MKYHLIESSPATISHLFSPDQALKEWSLYVIDALGTFLRNNKHCSTNTALPLIGGQFALNLCVSPKFIKNEVGSVPLATSEYPNFPGATEKTPPHTNLKFRSFYSNIEAGLLNYYAMFLPGFDFFFWSSLL